MDIVVYTLLGLSYVVIFILGYATRDHILGHRRHHYR